MPFIAALANRFGQAVITVFIFHYARGVKDLVVGKPYEKKYYEKDWDSTPAIEIRPKAHNTIRGRTHQPAEVFSDQPFEI